MFPIAVPDSQTTCRLYVEVRNHAAYPYRDLRLGLAVYRPDSTLLSSDTLCLMLADEQGAWLGTVLLKKISPTLLSRIFGIVMVVSAVRMFLR